jgi:hypothetical protein
LIGKHAGIVKEDAAPPIARSIEDIILETDITTDLASGAFLISVPLTATRDALYEAPLESLRNHCSMRDIQRFQQLAART